MPGRQFSSNTYRYGFNGKENDNETVGTGQGTQDYGLRIYNPALGKFLSVDPLAKEYPWNSTYSFAEGSPIANIDLDGAEREIKVFFFSLNNGAAPKQKITIDKNVLTLAAAIALAPANVPYDGIFQFYFLPDGGVAADYTYIDPKTKNARTVNFDVDLEQAADMDEKIQEGFAVWEAGMSGGKGNDGVATKGPSFKRLKEKIPNPWGKTGGPKHQNEVAKLKEEITERGGKFETEVKVETPGQTKNRRFMEVAEYDSDGNLVKYHQVGRENKNGTPVKREVRAMEDVKNSGDATPIEYHPYNK